MSDWGSGSGEDTKVERACERHEADIAALNADRMQYLATIEKLVKERADLLFKVKEMKAAYENVRGTMEHLRKPQADTLDPIERATTTPWQSRDPSRAELLTLLLAFHEGDGDAPTRMPQLHARARAVLTAARWMKP